MTTTSAAVPVPAHVPAELVFDFDVYNPPGAQDDYHLAFHALHEQGVPDIFWTPQRGGHWVATRGEDIYHIFKDYEQFSSEWSTVPREEHGRLPPIHFNPPQHTVYRSLIAPAFTPQAVGSLEAQARELTLGLLDEIQPKGECEFVSEFAQHLPIGIFMNMVNLPPEDRGYLLSLADKMVRPFGHDVKVETIGKIFEYVGKVIAERRANPGEDLISRIIREGAGLSDQELIGLCSLVLIGGLDTVASALGFVAHFLARNPEHRRKLIENPELAPRAADEFLRRFPVVNQGRVVDHDLVYKGVTMKKGEMIILPTTLHGLDERCFERPLEVDFERTSRTYSTFGNGPHRCPGSFLARVEMKVFLVEWLKRIPDFRIKPGEKVGVSGGVNGCLHYLPLVWDI